MFAPHRTARKLEEGCGRTRRPGELASQVVAVVVAMVELITTIYGLVFSCRAYWGWGMIHYIRLI